VFGGLVAATTVEGIPVHAPLPLGLDLAFVALVPDRDLATPEARGVLPDTVSRTDAVFNLGRMGLLVAGLADPTHLLAAATADRIHQPARTALFPEAPGLLEALVEAGALAACWSGAGPTLIGFVTHDSQESVRAAAESALAASGVPGKVVALQADRRGIVYGDEATVDL
jgi:homoserine kinase